MPVDGSMEPMKVRLIHDDEDVHRCVEDIITANTKQNAFYVCNVGDIVKKYDLWMEQMPRVEPYYAVKCNDSQLVISTLAALGTGFDCASEEEIAKVLQTKVPASRIIFANAAKPASHIDFAKASGVTQMTFDSKSELYKIKKHFPEARLLLRIRFDAKVADFMLGKKFGCDPETEAPYLLRKAQSMRIVVEGICFHVGSGCRDSEIFYAAIKACKTLFDYSAHELKHELSILDIGGGFQGDSCSSIIEVGYYVKKALAEFFPDEEAVRVIAEPGAYFVQSAYTLFTNVYAKRAVGSPEHGTRHYMYFINDGIYGSLNTMLYEQCRIVPRLWKRRSTEKWSSSIWGPTCDSTDVIWTEILLPLIHIGDWLIFDNTGAYTLSCVTKFNGFPCPEVFPVADVNTWHRLRASSYFKMVDFY